MPLPTLSDIRVDVILSNVSVMYAQQAKGFVAPRAFPLVKVKKQSDIYGVWDQGDFNRAAARIRGTGSTAAEAGYRVDVTNKYYCQPYALRKLVTAQERAQFDLPGDPDRTAVQYLTSQLFIQRDKQWAAAAFKTGVWGQDLTGVASGAGTNQFVQWDASGSHPIVDWTTAHGVVTDKVGALATGLRKVGIVGPAAHRKLRDHADVLDRIKYTQRAVVTEDLLAALLGLDEYIVAYPVETTSAEGATDTLAPIFSSKKALLMYVTTGPAINMPSAGYTFSWSDHDGVDIAGAAIKRYPAPDRDFNGADWVEGQIAFDAKVVASSLGVFFDTAVG